MEGLGRGFLAEQVVVRDSDMPMQGDLHKIERYIRYTKSGARSRSLSYRLGFSDQEHEAIAYQLIAGSTEIETIHSYGKKVKIFGFPGRPFIEDAYKEHDSEIKQELRKFAYLAMDINTTRWQMTQAKRELGAKFVQIVKDFVMSNHYQKNSKRVAEVKGDDFPLIFTGGLLNSMIPSFGGNHNHIALPEPEAVVQTEFEIEDEEAPF
jgi:hypothetical protein